MNDGLDVAALVDRYGGMVFRRCRRLLRNHDEALDACQDVFVRSSSGASVSTRAIPFSDAGHTRMLRPFVDAGGGPTVAYLVGQGANDPPARRTLSAYAGGGLDFLLSRSFLIGLTVHYNAMPNFSEPVGGRENFNGALVTFDFGWVFGKGRQ